MATILRHNARDVDDQASALAGWEQAYEQLGCGRFQGSSSQLVMREGSLFRESINRHHRQQVVPPCNHLVFSMALAPEPGSTFDGRLIARDSLLVFDHNSDHEVVSAGNIELIGITADMRMLESKMAPELLEWLQRKACVRNILLPGETAAQVRQYLNAICHEFALGPQQADGILQEHELLSSSLTRLVGMSMAADDSSTSGPRRLESRQKVVKRAAAFMRTKLYDDIDIAEICAAAYASRRTLHYCFWEFMHTTPQAYLRALRLNQARRSLKAQPDCPITDLATELGFSHASHFTRLYKEMFEELPSDTRGSGGGARYLTGRSAEHPSL